MQSRLSAQLASLHAAIVGAAGPRKALETSAQDGVGSESLATIAQPQISRLTNTTPEPRVKPYKPFAAEEAVRGSRWLSKGAMRLWTLIHDIGVFVALRRNHSPYTTQVVFSLPQSLVAFTLGYTDRHIRNLQKEVAAAGLLDSHALAAVVEGKNLWASTLWAVKLTAAIDTRPRLSPEDFNWQWRDFAQDLRKKETALSLISGLKTKQEAEWVLTVKDVAALGCFTPMTRSSFRPEKSLGSLKDSIYTLSLLADPDLPNLNQVVTKLSGALACGFQDQHSLRWWCRQCWGVVGDWDKITALQAALHRLITDCQEWLGLRKPAALLNARFR